jgi:hypothetical protein
MRTNSLNQGSREEHSSHSEKPLSWDEEELEIPPRRVLHQPEYMKITRYFHISLLTLFVLLTGGFFVWYHYFMN